MNNEIETIKTGLTKLQEDPMATRPTVRVLTNAILMLDRLEQELAVANEALLRGMDVLTSEILGRDKEGLFSNQEVLPILKKKGRPSKSASEV